MDGKGRKMGKGKEREGKEKDRTVKGRIGGMNIFISPKLVV